MQGWIIHCEMSAGNEHPGQVWLYRLTCFYFLVFDIPNGPVILDIDMFLTLL